MQTSIKVLLVEDEPSLALVVKDALEQHQYNVKLATNGDEALKAFHSFEPHIVILDIMIPKLNGFNVSKTIRNLDRKTPIIFLSAKIQAKDVVKGFESGGNDYLRKPFSMEELLIRMRVLLSGSGLLDQVEEAQKTFFDFGGFEFDYNRLELKFENNLRKLTSKEADLLQLFCEHQNQLLTKKAILHAIWGDDSFFNSRTMDVFISRLRKYMSFNPDITIINVRGVGYKLLIN
tara:strand:+ start:4420 stop:5118 length:699 start_codon:yes stop_codon:yes gene_type:complete